jgi:hypothetical protein
MKKKIHEMSMLLINTKCDIKKRAKVRAHLRHTESIRENTVGMTSIKEGVVTVAVKEIYLPLPHDPVAHFVFEQVRVGVLDSYHAKLSAQDLGHASRKKEREGNEGKEVNLKDFWVLFQQCSSAAASDVLQV